jgi:hypothetical protein
MLASERAKMQYAPLEVVSPEAAFKHNRERETKQSQENMPASSEHVSACQRTHLDFRIAS